MKKLIAILLISIMIISLCSCSGYDAEAMVSQAKAMVSENAFKTVIDQSGNYRTYLHYFHKNGSILEIQGIKNDERDTGDIKIITDAEYKVESADEVLVVSNNREVLKVVFKDGKPDCVFVNFSGSSYLATSYTNAFFRGREEVLAAEFDKCLEEGCDEFEALKSDSNYCNSHSGICALCNGYINKGEEYCESCKFDQGLPVEFTNNFSDASKKCDKNNCNNKIAVSGNTAYCASHSNECVECGAFTDEDTFFCIDCIEDAFRVSIYNK